MTDDEKVLLEALRVAQDLRTRTLLLDGCFPSPLSLDLAEQLRDVHRWAGELAQELERLTLYRAGMEARS